MVSAALQQHNQATGSLSNPVLHVIQVVADPSWAAAATAAAT
jgi:hypothetical protein